MDGLVKEVIEATWDYGLHWLESHMDSTEDIIQRYTKGVEA